MEDSVMKLLKEVQRTYHTFVMFNITKSNTGSDYYVDSKDCPVCYEYITVPIEESAMYAYHEGAPIEIVMGDYSERIRERFISGFCPAHKHII